MLLEPNDVIGRISTRETPTITVSRVISTPRSMMKGKESEGWISINIQTEESGDLFLSSMAKSPPNNIIILGSQSESALHLAPHSEFYSLSIRRSALVSDEGRFDVSSSILIDNACYQIPKHEFEQGLTNLHELLYSPLTSSEFTLRGQEFALRILSTTAKIKPAQTSDTRARCVSSSTQTIFEKYDMSLNLTDIVSECHCSVRTLDYAFRSILGITPKQFLNAYRLNMLRQMLVTDPRAHIGSVAYAMGYKHLGNLAKSYKRLFGELPSATQTLSQITN